MTSVMSHIIFLLLTWIIWTAGAAAVTQMLGGGLNCSGVSGWAYCGQLNALEAFAWILWYVIIYLALRPGCGFLRVALGDFFFV
jgi:hypothetical protein